MNRCKKLIAFLISLFAVTSWSLPCFAAENDVKEIFQSAVYGGLTGVVVGAAVLGFTHKPGDHLDYMGYGAAAGVLAGTAFGFYKVTKSLAEIENGKVKFAVPTIVPDFGSSNSGKSNAVAFRAELVRGTF